MPRYYWQTLWYGVKFKLRHSTTYEYLAAIDPVLEFIMSSGIYKLTFSSGRYYIGKSIDIDKRWKQHWKSMADGKHAKALQAEFDKYGEPEAEVLIYAHDDHIDILEGVYINHFWVPGKILNTTKPMPLEDDDFELVKYCIGYQGGAIWTISTLEHIRRWNAADEKARALEAELDSISEEHDAELEALKDGTTLQITEDALDLTKRELQDAKNEIKRLKNRGFWARLFND